MSVFLHTRFRGKPTFSIKFFSHISLVNLIYHVLNIRIKFQSIFQQHIFKKCEYFSPDCYNSTHSKKKIEIKMCRKASKEVGKTCKLKSITIFRMYFQSHWNVRSTRQFCQKYMCRKIVASCFFSVCFHFVQLFSSRISYSKFVCVGMKFGSLRFF